jgi:hypothetical protein
MEVKFKPSEEDLYELGWREAKHSPSLRRQYFAMYFGVPIAMAGFVVVLVLARGEGDDVVGWVWAGAFVAVSTICWFLWYPSGYRKSIRKQVQRTLKEGTSRVLLAERHFVFGTAGIQTRSEFGESALKWSAIERIEETPARLFLWLGPANAIIVPARAFSTEAGFREFVTFVHQQYASNHP